MHLARKTIPTRRYVIAVLTGSRSSERNYASSPWIIKALVNLGHEPVLVDLEEERLAPYLLGLSPDVVWPTGLGAGAEDGTLAGFIQTLLPGTPYVGSSVQASALAMDKEASKDAFRALGLAVPESVCFLPHQNPYGFGTLFQVSKPGDAAYLTPSGQPDFDRLVERLGLPLVVKPVGAGASLGLALVKDAQTFDQVCVRTAQRFGPLLVEQYIPSPCAESDVEYSVCLLEGEDPLPVFEVRSPTLYDTASKLAGARYHLVGGALAGALQAAAWAMFGYLGCRGFARVDFRLAPNGVPYPLEVNTNPGLIPGVSLFAKACAEIGLSYEQMITCILASAFRPHPRAVPLVAAEDAPPFPEEMRRLLPDLPPDLQPAGFYQSSTPQAPSVSIATYRC
jgi:D-alanine-D-alanine ligase